MLHTNNKHYVTLLQLVAVVVVVGVPVVSALPMDTCDAQKDCLEIRAVPTPVFHCDGSDHEFCEWETCLHMHMRGKHCPTSVSHVCKKPTAVCIHPLNNQTGFPVDYEGIPFAHSEHGGYEYTMCQVVGPNTLVEFIIKDGFGCNSEEEGNKEVQIVTDFGGKATCKPRPVETESCTGNAPGVECVWTFYTPPCPGAPSKDSGEESSKSASNFRGSIVSHPGLSSSIEKAIEKEEEEQEKNKSNPTTYNKKNKKHGGINGDPHIKTWKGLTYDYHGICDLILLSIPGFNNGLGLDIHVRTKQTLQWSYVSTAAIRIGDEILEVAGKKDGNTYWINGIPGGTFQNNHRIQGITTLYGFTVQYKRINKQQTEFIIDLNNNITIGIKTWNDFVRVDIPTSDIILNNNDGQRFEHSKGLMGSFPDGIKYGRDNITIYTDNQDDLNEFGQQWQVLDTEPKLFLHKLKDGPQYPSKCVIPQQPAATSHHDDSNHLNNDVGDYNNPDDNYFGFYSNSANAAEVQRRLEAIDNNNNKITLEDAHMACSHVNKDERDSCVFDVMATNNKNVAQSY